MAHAARSSDDTSRRIKRRHQRFREEGRPVGGPPGFGFPRLDRCDPSSADGEPGSEPGGRVIENEVLTPVVPGVSDGCEAADDDQNDR